MMKRRIITTLLCGMAAVPGFAVELSAPPGQPAAAAQPEAEPQWELHGQSESVMLYHNVKGGGETTVSDGTTFRQELGLRSEGRLGEGNAGLSFSGRATDDDRVSTDHAEVTSLRAYYADSAWDLAAGDVAQTYSTLVFNGALRGATATYTSQFEEQGSVRYSVIAGVQSASWKDLFEHETTHTDVVAGEIRYQHATAQRVSFSVSAANDREGSTEIALDVNASEAMTAGIAWDWRFNRYVKSRGDLAWTSVKGADNRRRERYAGRVDVMTRPTRELSSNFGYERYENGFDSLVGSSTEDRERLENTTVWNASRELRARISLKYSRDNLDGALGETQKIYDGLLALDYRPEFMQRGNIGLRLQRKRMKGRGDDTFQTNVGIDVSNRLESGWRYGATYDYTDLENDDDPSASNTLHTVRAQLGWKKRYSEDHNFRAGARADYSFYDVRTDDQKRFGGTVDAGWDYGRNFMLDLLLTSTNTDRDLSADTSYELYQLIGQYRPFGDGSHVLKINLQRRDSDGGGSAESVIEDEARISYAFRF